MATGSPFHEPSCVLNCSFANGDYSVNESNASMYAGNHNKVSKEAKCAFVATDCITKTIYGFGYLIICLKYDKWIYGFWLRDLLPQV